MHSSRRHELHRYPRCPLRLNLDKFVPSWRPSLRAEPMHPFQRIIESKLRLDTVVIKSEVLRVTALIKFPRTVAVFVRLAGPLEEVEAERGGR